VSTEDVFTENLTVSQKVSAVVQDSRTVRLDDPSLLLAHGTDAPDPDDPAEPADLADRMDRLRSQRISRRAFVGGALGAGAVLASPFGTGLATAGKPPSGDAASLNAALDKEYLRRWMAENRGYTGDGPPPALPDDVRVEGARRYIEIFELVTGRAFSPQPGDPLARIAANLGLD